MFNPRRLTKQYLPTLFSRHIADCFGDVMQFKLSGNIQRRKLYFGFVPWWSVIGTASAPDEGSEVSVWARPRCIWAAAGRVRLWRYACRSGHAVARGMVAVALLACSPGYSASNPADVRGRTYKLRAVDGDSLPARFTPFEDVRGAGAVLDSGRVSFDRNGQVRGAWQGTGDSDNAMSRVFHGTYVQEGSHVLIQTAPGAPPDTGEVSGSTLTVRAQFYRQPSRQRFVVVMIYEQ